MAYELERGTSLQESLRKVIGGEVDKALAHLRDPELGRRESVHEVRKRCKRARAALRLVRDALGPRYARENARYRDIGRLLAPARDARARLAAFEELRGRFASGPGDGPFETVQRALAAECERAERSPDLGAALREVERELRAAREAAGDLTLEGGFGVLRGGLLRAYGRGRKRMDQAYADPLPERFHAWRKRVKDHRHHARLLRPLWEPVLGARRDEAGELSDLLGDDHDLAVLRLWAEERRAALAAPREVDALLERIDRRRAELLTRARPLGERLFAEKPSDFGARLRRYWRAWRSRAERLANDLEREREPARS